jgi:branched-chain amino acid transport system permease protein
VTFFVQQVINGLVVASVLALFSLGFALVFAQLGIFYVTQQAIFTWGAVLCWLMMVKVGTNLYLASIVAIVGCSILNVTAYRLVLIRMLKERNGDMRGFVACLGLSTALVELADNTIGHEAVHLPADAIGDRTWIVADVSFSFLQIVTVIITAVMFGCLLVLINHSQFGRSVRSIAADHTTAEMLGVNRNLIIVAVMILSGSFAAIGAILVALSYSTISSSLGANYLLLSVAVIVLGGFGSLPGVVGASVLIGLTSSLATGYLDTSDRDLIVFSLVFATLMLRPAGLFAVASSAKRA